MPFNLDFFTELTDLTPLLRYVEQPFDPSVSQEEGEDEETDSPPAVPPTPRSILSQKYRKLSANLCDFLTDYGLVSFLPIHIHDGEVRGSWLVLFG